VTTAERLDKITQQLDPFGYMDSDMNVEMFEDIIKNKPEDAIDWLIDQIELLLS